jgi:hypothetical protein
MAITPFLRQTLATAAAVLAVSGCAGTELAPPEVNLSGYPGEFKQGYADGCDSARGWRTRKDEARYGEDVDYMMGWNDGYSVCGRRR